MVIDKCSNVVQINHPLLGKVLIMIYLQMER